MSGKSVAAFAAVCLALCIGGCGSDPSDPEVTDPAPPADESDEEVRFRAPPDPPPPEAFKDPNRVAEPACLYCPDPADLKPGRPIDGPH